MRNFYFNLAMGVASVSTSNAVIVSVGCVCSATVCRSAPDASAQHRCLLSLSAESVLAALPWQRWTNAHLYHMPLRDETNAVLVAIDGRSNIVSWFLYHGSFVHRW